MPLKNLCATILVSALLLSSAYATSPKEEEIVELLHTICNADGSLNWESFEEISKQKEDVAFFTPDTIQLLIKEYSDFYVKRSFFRNYLEVKKEEIKLREELEQGEKAVMDEYLSRPQIVRDFQDYEFQKSLCQDQEKDFKKQATKLQEELQKLTHFLKDLEDIQSLINNLDDQFSSYSSNPSYLNKSKQEKEYKKALEENILEEYNTRGDSSNAKQVLENEIRALTTALNNLEKAFKENAARGQATLEELQQRVMTHNNYFSLLCDQHQKAEMRFENMKKEERHFLALRKIIDEYNKSRPGPTTLDSFELLPPELKKTVFSFSSIENVLDGSLTSKEMLTLLRPISKVKREEMIQHLGNHLGSVEELKHRFLDHPRHLRELVRAVGPSDSWLTESSFFHIFCSNIFDHDYFKLKNYLVKLKLNREEGLSNELLSITSEKFGNMFGNIKVLPKEIGDFMGLEKLEIGLPDLFFIPPEILTLTSLKTLRIYKDFSCFSNPQDYEFRDHPYDFTSSRATIRGLEDFLQVIDKFENLEELSLHALTTFPPKIYNLKKLKTLALKRQNPDGKITMPPPFSISDQFMQLTSLENIFLSQEDVEALPRNILKWIYDQKIKVTPYL